MYAATRTVSLQGAVGHVVEVQVDVTAGLIYTSVVGRPDASINEGKTRVDVVGVLRPRRGGASLDHMRGVS